MFIIVCYIINILYLLHITKADQSFDYCPISKSIKSSESGLFTYPIEFFNIKRKYKSKEYKYYHCNLAEINAPKRTCAYPLKSCPLTENDVINSRLKLSSLNYRHSLCNSLDIDNKNPKRIVIFGGSVTAGWSSNGCFCDESINQKCPLKTPTYNDTARYCRWGGRFEEWWTSRSVNSEVHVIGMGGSSSPYMADFIEIKVKENLGNKLNRNDIVFIDHSVNDGASLFTKEGQMELIEGLERFIRNIYKQSIPGSWPTIILLEMWPFTAMIRDLNQRPDKLSENQLQYEYSRAYVKIAKAYGLPIWSYRDLIWSDYIEQQYDVYTLNLLRFQENSDHIHPPWVVHLYYADLIANNLLYESNLCQKGDNNDHIFDSNEMYLDKLIAPISKDPTFDCDDKYLLDLTASTFYPPAKDTKSHKLGSFVVNPSNAFTVYEDRPNKIGWIDEIFNNDTSYKSNITFYFDNKNNQLTKRLHLLKVYYFRTYLNGGIFDVTLCGDYIQTLDTLWTEVRYHTSETRIFQFKLDPIEYKYCLDSNIATLTFTHKYIKENNLRSRKNEKVKLVAVKICDPLN